MRKCDARYAAGAWLPHRGSCRAYARLMRCFCSSSLFPILCSLFSAPFREKRKVKKEQRKDAVALPAAKRLSRETATGASPCPTVCRGLPFIPPLIRFYRELTHRPLDRGAGVCYTENVKGSSKRAQNPVISAVRTVHPGFI